MAIRVEVLDREAIDESLRRDWDELVAKSAESILGHDATSGVIWFEALSSAFPEARHAKLIVARDGDSVLGILPLLPEKAGWLGWRAYAPSALHGGRNGLVLAQPRADVVTALLGAVRRAIGRWESVRLVVVERGDSDCLLREACLSGGYRLFSETAGESPYFPIRDHPDSFAAGMSKGLKQTLRTATNKFRALGEIQYREIARESDAEQAIQAILEIDRASWKHSAGTAITCHPEQERFYRALFGPALRARLLYGQILLLKGRPIAFSFGLVFARMFCCLKHSQAMDLQSHSPGQLLTASLIASLREMGVCTFDFMGQPEPHKLRWSDAVGLYERRLVWIYNESWFGRTAFALRSSRLRLGRLRGSLAQLVRLRAREGNQAR